eukprot:366329-Chlamydomonas_euryale.AAC.3
MAWLQICSCPVRVARYGPYPFPPSPYVLHGGRDGTYDDGSTGGRAGGLGEGAVWPCVNTKCSS